MSICVERVLKPHETAAVGFVWTNIGLALCASFGPEHGGVKSPINESQDLF